LFSTITSEHLKSLQQRSEENNIFSPNSSADIVHSYMLCFIKVSFSFSSQSIKQEERGKKRTRIVWL